LGGKKGGTTKNEGTDERASGGRLCPWVCNVTKTGGREGRKATPTSLGEPFVQEAEERNAADEGNHKKSAMTTTQ